MNMNNIFWPKIENTITFLWLFTGDDFAYDFALQHNVIYNTLDCQKCKIPMQKYIDTSKGFGLKWKCPGCHKTKSLFYGSLFSSAKLPLTKIFHLLYCWAYQYSCKDTQREVGVSSNTVTYYFTLFRKACDAYVISLGGIQVGGPGKTVQIDETLMCRRKFNVGRILNQVWIFGGICIEDKKFFCLVVPDRSRNTLEVEIRKHILPGTKIVSDCWKAYDFLNEESDYEYQSVNHSKNFVDPKTKANTQALERLWRELKKINKKYEGIPRHKVNEHISEFLWRCDQIHNENQKFRAAVELIANTKFIKVVDNMEEEEEEEET